MASLITQHCVPCKGDLPPLSEREIRPLCSDIPNWRIVENRCLQRVFTFETFRGAIEFVTQIANLAEQEGHHPNIAIDYNKVTIDIWTHKINGLTESDFILAAKIDGLRQ